MPKTHEMIESKYLKKEDVDRPLLVTVNRLEKQNLAQEGKTPEMLWCMYFAELSKPLVLKTTNIQLCEMALGSDDTDDWLGKKLVLYTDPNVSMNGKLVGGIRVRAPKLAAPVPQRQPAPPPRESATEAPFSDFEDDLPF